MILEPIKINNINFSNRIVVVPMCQYSADNGNPTMWHFGHYQQLVNSGPGCIMLESTAVNYSGRISTNDLVLKTENNFKSFKRLVSYLKNFKPTVIGLQISHSGRKGSSELPWIKKNCPIMQKKKRWQTFSASSIKRDNGWPKPKSLSINEIKKIIRDFENSARLANKANFDCLEIHMAHGYLLHQFFSPISNKRTDIYGGSFLNRTRILLEVARTIRQVWPNKKVLGARITGSDFLKDGISISDAEKLALQLKEIGLDYLCVSSGGIKPITNLKFYPGYQVHLARRIKRKTGIIVRTAGLIRNLAQANKIINSNSADFVGMGRKFIYDPTWLLREMKKKKIPLSVAPQYLGCF